MNFLINLYAAYHVCVMLSCLLSPTLSAWPLRGHTALKSILCETLFLDQMHDFSLLTLNSFLQPFSKSKFTQTLYQMYRFLLSFHTYFFEIYLSIVNHSEIEFLKISSYCLFNNLMWNFRYGCCILSILL